MGATDTFESPSDFAGRLRSLRESRRARKIELRDDLSRASLSPYERKEAFDKTGGHCHICGGQIEGMWEGDIWQGEAWEADHVSPHSLGGQHSQDNYLPAHRLCNRHRFFYGPEEFQWILKLGVWLRTKIENETAFGRAAAKAFCAYDRKRASRSRQPLAAGVTFIDERMIVRLLDGRELCVPLDSFPRLQRASARQRKKWELVGGGLAIHWPLIDEDISVELLLAPRPQRRRRVAAR